MKFLIITKHSNKADGARLEPDTAVNAKQHLAELQKNILDEAYIFESGGAAFVVNVDHCEAIALEASQHEISLHCKVEIHPVTCLHAKAVKHSEERSDEWTYEPTL